MLIIGIILPLVAPGLCIYAVKPCLAYVGHVTSAWRKSEGPSTPKAGSTVSDVEMAGVQIRKTMKLSTETRSKWKATKVQNYRRIKLCSHGKNWFRAGHVFDDDDDDLPPGWVAIKDEESGDYYYYNAAADLTQWEKLSKAATEKIKPQSEQPKPQKVLGRAPVLRNHLRI